MKNIKKHLRILEKYPMSVIVRTNNADDAHKVIKNAVENGFKFVEITLTIPNVYQIISETKKKYPEIIIGAGTVLILEEAKKAVQMGAQYLVSPIFTKEILKWSLENDILYAPGATTVNEMYQAYQKGAQLIKFYPAASMPAKILKLIFGPFPNFKILATGGINLENMDDYFESGVYAIGITGKLGGNSQNNIQYEEISKLAKKYIEKMQKIIVKKNFDNLI